MPGCPADFLCRALGYTTGFIVRENTGNTCPEPHPISPTEWTSDFVSPSGYGAEYECVF